MKQPGVKQPTLFEAQSDAGALPFGFESFWAIEPGAFARLRETLASVSPDRLAALGPLSAADRASSTDTLNPGYETQGGVAVVRLEGVVSKRQTLLGRIFGGQAVTTKVAAALRAADADPSVKSILMVIDSPGGTVDGTSDLADVLAGCTKPTAAYCEDLCASAAYWIASQADTLVGGSTASVGSIGVFSVLPDVSRLAKNIGVEVNVVRSAPGKGGGTMGAQVTDAQLADVQKHVDALHAQFVSAVARGRGISVEKAAALADGRIHVGAGAVTAGLLDRVDSLASVLTGMQAAAGDDETLETKPDDEKTEPNGLAAGGSSNTTTRAEAPETEPRAEVKGHLTAHKEDTMAETNPTASVTPAQLDALAKTLAATNERLEALAKENAALKANLDGVSGNVVAITTERETSALIAKARAEVKLTKGNEAVVEPMLRAMAAIDLEKAKAYVEHSMKPLGKGEGSLLATATAAAAANQALEPGDHVGSHLAAYKPDRGPVHQAAVDFMARSRQAGKPVSYAAAVIAVTRKSAA